VLPSYLQIKGKPFPLVLRKNSKARRLTLRWSTEGGGQIILTHPPRYSKSLAFTFLEKSHPWIEKQLITSPPKISFTEGLILPILGKNYELRHKVSTTFRSWWGDNHLLIHAPMEHFGSFVQKALQQVARNFLQERTLILAAQIQKEVKRITLRETKSRWGSCSADGNISYSWRLIFAPEQVADYLCAHEVAHLIHMDHSPHFWQIVEGLCPEYKVLRQWLRKNGKTLFQYGL